MKKNCIKIRLFLISVFSLVSTLLPSAPGQNSNTANDSVSIEVIMTDKMFGDFKPGTGFIPAIDITAERFILLSAPDQYYVLGWGGVVPLGTRMKSEISSFAYTPDGLLLTVCGKDLCSFDGNGNLSPVVRLPRSEMGISAGLEVMYLFDRTPGQKAYPLYVFAREGKYMKLLESPDPISSVAETDNTVLFAAGSKLYSVNPGTKEVKLMYTEENGRKIISVTTDRSNHIIYFSTAEKVFAVSGSDLATVSDKAGGILRYYNGLIVFNPEAKQVIRILGLEKELIEKPQAQGEVTFRQGPVTQATQATQATQTNRDAQVTQTTQTNRDAQVTQTAGVTLDTQGTQVTKATQTDEATRPAAPVPGKSSGDIATVKVLTNESVVSLVKNELSDNIIIGLIRRAKVDFSLTTDDVIDLSGKGVSPDVVIEMRQAMKRQDAEKQNR